jgi:SAM-dependent methyltransferase
MQAHNQRKQTSNFGQKRSMETDSLLQKNPNLTKIMLNRRSGALVILLAWYVLIGDAQPAPISRFDLRSTEVLKFASAFGSVEASNDTIEKVLQLGSPGLDLSSKSLVAFEENRSFVYALFSPSDAVESARRQPGSPRRSRRLIFLKPSIFVLDDEVKAGSSPVGAEWLLQSRTRPSIQGRFASMVEEESEMNCETLLPEKASRQVKQLPSVDKLLDAYALQVFSKQPSQRFRFVHVLHIRRRGEKNSIARTRLVPNGDELHLTIEASQQTYRLVLPSAQVGAGEIEISRDDTKNRLDRRFFPAGVLPHGREGVRQLELWDGSYRGGKRPFWDAGVPSGELRRVVEQGIVRPGPAVDLGCGSGTDAIYLASKGFDVTAIDIAPTALSQGREKAERAGVKVRWLLANVLSLPRLEPFQFIFDRGCYHEVRFDNAAAYVDTVRKLSQPGRTRFLLLAGNPNEAPVQYAPPQVAEEDIRGDFSSLFDFEWLQETRFETSNPAARGPLAWSVMLRRKE